MLFRPVLYRGVREEKGNRATCEQNKPAFPVGLVSVAFLLDARREFLYVLCELLHLVTGSFASPTEYLAGT